MNKKQKATLALGNFDGIHKGHAKIIQQAIDVSCKDEVYVCSFEPHPLQILKNNPPKIITPLKQKVRIIEEIIGVNYFAMKFDMELAKLSGEEFILMLLDNFDIKNVVVGANYYFGDKAKYSTKDLKELGDKYSFNVYVVDELKIYDEIVSSTRIRKCLSDGNVELANELLGRNYCISGICKKGRGIGKSIGYATANLSTEPKNQYPKQGVYATKTLIDGEPFISMTNVGYNPTVTSEHKRMIETHILGFDRVLYDEHIYVEFIERIRDEVKFESVDELKRQLELDKQEVENIFNKTL